MATILDSNAEFTPTLLLTIEELQFNNNDYLNMYISYLNTIMRMLFEQANQMSESESKNEIFGFVKTNHELRELLETFRAPINS